MRLQLAPLRLLIVVVEGTTRLLYVYRNVGQLHSALSILISARAVWPANWAFPLFHLEPFQLNSGLGNIVRPFVYT